MWMNRTRIVVGGSDGVARNWVPVRAMYWRCNSCCCPNDYRIAEVYSERSEHR